MASLGSAWMTSPEARGTPPWDRVDQLPRSGGSPPSERIGIRTRLGSNVESELDLLIKNRHVSCWSPLKRVDHVPWKRMDHLPRSAWITPVKRVDDHPWSAWMISLGARG
jgi:hypothetical protein